MGKGLRSHLTNPPPPYVDKRVHLTNPPPPLGGYMVCVWPLVEKAVGTLVIGMHDQTKLKIVSVGITQAEKPGHSQ